MLRKNGELRPSLSTILGQPPSVLLFQNFEFDRKKKNLSRMPPVKADFYFIMKKKIQIAGLLLLILGGCVKSHPVAQLELPKDILADQDGHCARGDCKNGKEVGKNKNKKAVENVFIYDDGSTYTGEFSKGFFHGKGKLFLKDGRSFAGKFVGGG